MADSLVSGLQSEIERLTVRNGELAFQISLKSEEIEKLRGGNEAASATPRSDDLLLQIEVLKLHKKEFEAKEAEFESTKLELAALKLKQQAEPELSIHLQERIAHMQAELDHAKQEVTKLVALDAEAQLRAAEAVKEKADLMKRCTELQELAAHAKPDAHVTSPDIEQQQLIRVFEEEMRQLKHRIVSEGELNQSNLQAKEGENKALRDQNVLLEAERNTATASLRELQISTRANPSVISELQRQVQRLEEQLATANTEVARMRMQAESAKAEAQLQIERFETLQNTSAVMISEASARADAAERAAAVAQERLKKVEGHRTQAQEERESFAFKAADAEGRLQGVRSEMEQHLARVRQLEGEVKILEQEVDLREKEAATLRTQVAEAKNESRSGVQELAVLRTKESELQARLKKAEGAQTEYDRLVLLQKTWQLERSTLQEELNCVHAELVIALENGKAASGIAKNGPMIPVKAAQHPPNSAAPAAPIDDEKMETPVKPNSNHMSTPDKKVRVEESPQKVSKETRSAPKVAEKEKREQQKREQERKRERKEKERKEAEEKEREREKDRREAEDRVRREAEEKEKEAEKERERQSKAVASPMKANKDASSAPRSLGLRNKSAPGGLPPPSLSLAAIGEDDAVPAAAKRARTESTPAAAAAPTVKFTLAFTGYRDEEAAVKAELSQIAQRLGCAVNSSSEFDQSITHVLSPNSCKTMKTLAAALTGRWLLTDRWLRDSSAAGHLLPEGAYGKRYTGRPFEGKRFALSTAFRGAGAHVKDAQDLIELGRGQLITDESLADIVIVPNRWRDTQALAVNPRLCIWNHFIQLIAREDDEEGRQPQPPAQPSTSTASKPPESEKRGVHFDDASPCGPAPGGKRKKSSASQGEDDKDKEKSSSPRAAYSRKS